jgi:hypothetical protein
VILGWRDTIIITTIITTRNIQAARPEAAAVAQAVTGTRRHKRLASY